MSTKHIKDFPVAFRVQLHKDLLSSGILPSCINCVSSNTEQVSLLIHTAAKISDPATFFCNKFNAVPPIRVAVCGCDAWEQGIPF